MTRRLLLFTTAVALLLSACGPSVKRYPLTGEVKLLDPKAKIATVQHDKIGDWMGAMTMEFPVKPDVEFFKMHVGDKIEAEVVVQGDKYHLTDVKVTNLVPQQLLPPAAEAPPAPKK